MDLLDLLFDDAPPMRNLTLVRFQRRAMATGFEIAFPLGTPHAYDAAHAALDLVEELEDQLTVYRDTSEVSRLNATASDGPVIVEKNLFDLLQQCAILTNETAGAFDVVVGSLVKCWGFYQREGRVPTETELADAMNSSGFRHVILDPAERSVRYRRSGLQINLGAIGKGYALDRAAELLKEHYGIESALLTAGGSSVFALGSPPTDFRGWPIRLRHPTIDRRHLGTVYLRNRSLGTSAATFQYFEYNGKKYGHVLDPRTGRPFEGTASASCLAPTASEADAISTAFFVAGAEWAAEFCRGRPHLGCVLLPEGAELPETLNLDYYDKPGLRE